MWRYATLPSLTITREGARDNRYRAAAQQQHHHKFKRTIPVMSDARLLAEENEHGLQSHFLPRGLYAEIPTPV